MSFYIKIISRATFLSSAKIFCRTPAMLRAKQQANKQTLGRNVGRKTSEFLRRRSFRFVIRIHFHFVFGFYFSDVFGIRITSSVRARAAIVLYASFVVQFHSIAHIHAVILKVLLLMVLSLNVLQHLMHLMILHQFWQTMWKFELTAIYYLFTNMFYMNKKYRTNDDDDDDIIVHIRESISLSVCFLWLHEIDLIWISGGYPFHLSKKSFSLKRICKKSIIQTLDQLKKFKKVYTMS